jgi:hypothetical protein
MLTSERELDIYLSAWMARKFPRFLTNRFFQATVVVATARATFGYLCTVTMIGETAVVGPFLSPWPASIYTPATGHVVQCEWLDDSTALINCRLS